MNVAFHKSQQKNKRGKIMSDSVAVKHVLGLWVVLRPDSLELVKVVWAENRPITCEIVKVVHDDSHKQVNNLERNKSTNIYECFSGFFSHLKVLPWVKRDQAVACKALFNKTMQAGVHLWETKYGTYIVWNSNYTQHSCNMKFGDRKSVV